MKRIKALIRLLVHRYKRNKEKQFLYYQVTYMNQEGNKVTKTFKNKKNLKIFLLNPDLDYLIYRSRVIQIDKVYINAYNEHKALQRRYMMTREGSKRILNLIKDKDSTQLVIRNHPT